MMTIVHPDPHPLAGQWVTVTTASPLHGQTGTTTRVRVGDWYTRISGCSWQDTGTRVAADYMIRTLGQEHTTDVDDVVYVTTGDQSGHLVHVSEITTPGGDR